MAFRQKSSAATWIGAAMGFVGIVLVLGPQHNNFNVGALLALAGALLLAIALMSVRWLGATEPMPRILFYYFAALHRDGHADRRARLATL
jgi:drug/metabolite transporter (DMT)-like permease